MSWRFFRFLRSSVVSLFIFLLIVGCSPSDDNTLQRNFKVGYGELAVVVDEQRSPLTVYQNRPFALFLNLFNRAGYDATAVKISLANYDQTYLQIFTAEQMVPLIEARNAFTDDNGGRADVLFTGDVLSLRDAQEKYSKYRNFFLYQSNMEFASTMCLNPAAYRVFDAGCEMPSRPVSFAGQGAPLAVTQMEEIVVGSLDAPELELRFIVENRGRGDVKKVRLGQSRIGNQPLPCQFKSVIEHTDGSVSFKPGKQEGQLICSKTLSDQWSYQTPLFIEFFYDYEFSEVRPLLIRQ